MSARKRKRSDPDIGTSPTGDRFLTVAESPSVTKRLLTSLVAVMMCIMTARFFLGEPPNFTIVSVFEKVERRASVVPCSQDYDSERNKFQECTPIKCARIVKDYVIEKEEALKLLEIAKRGLALGGSNGGASILDLHTGALSKGDRFMNIYSVLPKLDYTVFTDEDFKLYREVKGKIHQVIASEFGINPDKLYLTNPTFFSQMTSKPANTIHDEYWHPHIDKETYGSFDYTSLLYLTDFSKDFTGGRFVFMDKDANRTVEPRVGRLSFFTSGSENLHYVEKVRSGTRYAITVSFSCDPHKAIGDPTLKHHLSPP